MDSNAIFSFSVYASQMSMEMDDDGTSPLDSLLGEVKELEQDIALADYELRNGPLSSLC
jgi:hypothetical protein